MIFELAGITKRLDIGLAIAKIAPMDMLAEFRKVLNVESAALSSAAARADENVLRAVEILHGCTGRVIVTGMGKAGLIGRKIAATMTSTGTPAMFLHPAEAIHGDLGMVTAEDAVLALSNSGETEEIVRLLNHLKRFGVKVIAITGGTKSTLARAADAVLDSGVEEEGDPLRIAPMASTTVQLGLGDALAAVLLLRKGFTAEDFARYHPGGSLGRKLLLRVGDLMHSGEEIPVVAASDSLRQMILTMGRHRLGVCFALDERGHLEGIFTDGDLRRLMERETDPLDRGMADVMTRGARSVPKDWLAVEALAFMETHKISVVPVLDGERVVGALHLHDLLRAGLQ